MQLQQRLCIPCKIFCGCGKDNCEKRFNTNDNEDDDNDDDKIENQEEEHDLVDEN